MKFLTEPVVVRGYPIPPSDNAIKKPVRRFVKGGIKRVLTFMDSPEYVRFKSDLNFWWLSNFRNYSDDFMTVKNWVRDGKVLGIECDMRIHHERIWTVKGRPQRLDPANRLKALQDTLSKLIQIDDSVFFETIVRKVEIPKDRRECFYLKIGPIEPGKVFHEERS